MLEGIRGLFNGGSDEQPQTPLKQVIDYVARIYDDFEATGELQFAEQQLRETGENPLVDLPDPALIKGRDGIIDLIDGAIEEKQRRAALPERAQELLDEALNEERLTQGDLVPVYPLDRLGEIHEEQAKRLVDLKFHRKAGFGWTPQGVRNFLRELPPFPEVPAECAEEYAERFPFPLIIFRHEAVPLEASLEAIRGRSRILLQKVSDEPKALVKGSRTFTTFVNDAERNLGVSDQEAQEGFTRNEVGATLYIAVNFAIQYPKEIRQHGVNVVGSRFGHRVPFLSTSFDCPIVDAYSIDSIDSSNPFWGALTRGMHIGI